MKALLFLAMSGFLVSCDEPTKKPAAKRLDLERLELNQRADGADKAAVYAAAYEAGRVAPVSPPIAEPEPVPDYSDDIEDVRDEVRRVARSAARDHEEQMGEIQAARAEAEDARRFAEALREEEEFRLRRHR